MILVDANLLLYAVAPESPDHEAAHAWLEARLNDVDRVGLAWTTLLAFVRLSSNPRVAARALSPSQAWAFVEKEWLSRPNVWIPAPGASYARILTQLFENFATTSRKVTDAHAAALAIEHGLILCSADRDFANLPGLQYMNPLRPTMLHERRPFYVRR